MPELITLHSNHTYSSLRQELAQVAPGLVMEMLQSKPWYDTFSAEESVLRIKEKIAKCERYIHQEQLIHHLHRDRFPETLRDFALRVWRDVYIEVTHAMGQVYLASTQEYGNHQFIHRFELEQILAKDPVLIAAGIRLGKTGFRLDGHRDDRLYGLPDFFAVSPYSEAVDAFDFIRNYSHIQGENNRYRTRSFATTFEDDVTREALTRALHVTKTQLRTNLLFLREQDPVILDSVQSLPYDRVAFTEIDIMETASLDTVRALARNS